MRRWLLLALTLLVPLVAMAGAVVNDALSQGPNRETCEGYPEPRIFLENQSWWEPQPVNGSHPGNGKQGHIHLGVCVPLYQTLTGGTIQYDVKVMLHNLAGVPGKVKLQHYIGNVGGESVDVVPYCATADCTSWHKVTVDLSKATWNGWYELAFFVNVTHTDSSVQRNWTRYYVNLQVPGKQQTAVGQNGSLYDDWTRGTGWYNPWPAGSEKVWPSKYSHAGIHRQDIPWDETTGKLTPVSGQWQPRITIDRQHQFAYVDPNLHAPGGPDYGTVLVDQIVDVPPGDNYLGRLGTEINKLNRLTIDTTKLSNGLHWLVIGSGNISTPRGPENAGVLKVPFLVENGCVP
jgi:hypothetical protein